ncbi:MAG: F0F1 ATP synthase subunit delta [Pseudohongiella sp.]|nr:F0F1 ATP synthase subunit delta [Pseudohongiella sp.]MDO9521007.1 F0F1 ATP synthase subunit delta [Pseudohongiella sp.]MDP2126843.1 F0F1 ATP synthase subunit delta [Pseudohongiella sp.]
MAESITLARPYANAAFEVAAADNALAQWSQMLRTLAAVTSQEKISNLLKSPALTATKQSDALLSVCGDSVSDKGSNMVRLLAENRRLALLPQISELFDTLKAAREKSIDVEVSTAYALSDAVVKSLTAALEKRLDRTVKLHSSVDQQLIGGVVIRAGDTVIDNSVRGKLNKLAESLSS